MVIRETDLLCSLINIIWEKQKRNHWERGRGIKLGGCGGDKRQADQNCMHYVIYEFMYKVTIQTSGQRNQMSLGSTSAPLLSDLYIQIPKPQASKRVLPIDPPPPQWFDADSPQKASDSHCFIFSGTRTKNSSASLPFKSESEIISDWVRTLFQKRGLLGPIWQQKLQLKRKQLLTVALIALKQYEPPQHSAYLQTQSRYKPPLQRKVNNLLVMGIQKLIEVLPKLQLQRKQIVFSHLLRYLAFQHMNTLTRCKSEETINVSMGLREFKKMPLSPRALPYNPSREEYELEMNRLHPFSQGKQSQKHIPRIQNQYALTPFADNPKELQASRTPRSSRHTPLPPSIPQSMRQSSNSIKIESIPMKESMHYRMEYCQQEHRMTYDPLRESQKCFGNPPSPNNLKFMPISTPQMFFPQPQQPQYHNPQINFNTLSRTDQIRQCTRPQTHNPFPNRSTHKDPSPSAKEPQRAPESRSRAVSASPNVKISFMGVANTNSPRANYMQPVKNQKRNVPNDYEGGELMKANNVHKLGTAENKQMRQIYQVNSWDNELVPQDYTKMNYNPFLSPMTPNPLLQPMTPQHLQSPQQKIMLSPQRPMPMSPNGPMSPSSPRIAMNRPSPRVHRQLEPRSPTGNDYNMRRREKLTVTASRRRH